MKSATNKQNPFSPRGFPQATVVLCRWQRVAAFVLLAVLAVGAIASWRTELLVLNALLTLFYLASLLYRMLCLHRALKRPAVISPAPEELAAPPGDAGEWPRYLVLLPLYREADILPALIANMKSLDYPADRLEIRLLVEADDDETREAAERLALAPPFTVKLVPPSMPRTKPKACNVGLEGTDADFLVIYDAEDRPDPSQLKAAVAAFAHCSEKVICLQARLDYFNSRANLLTCCFTAEYATWFGLCLPGLDSLRAPIPLGGTSNHFRLAPLRAIGGWDEYNVTEDCDLGLRLFADGYQTRLLDSTTQELACDNLGGWLRQRSRWVKGYLQTYLVHTRDFLGLHRRLGLWNALQFHLLIGGSVLSQLLNPLTWLLTAIWLVLRPDAMGQFFPLPVFLMGSICLFAGNFIFIYSGALACLHRRLGRLVPCALLMPFYWLLMSLAAWKGVLQLFTRPHFWEKTTHLPAATATAAAPVAPATPIAATTPAAPVAPAPATPTAPVAPTASVSHGFWVRTALPALALLLFAIPGLFKMFLHHALLASFRGPSGLDIIVAYLQAGHGWGTQALAGSWAYPPLVVLGNLLCRLGNGCSLLQADHGWEDIVALASVVGDQPPLAVAGGLLSRMGDSRFWLFDVVCLFACLWQFWRWYREDGRLPLLFIFPTFVSSLCLSIWLRGNANWPLAVLTLAALRHLCPLARAFDLRHLAGLAVAAALMVFCGPGGIWLAIVLLAAAIPAIESPCPRGERGGRLLTLCLPLLGTLSLAVFWNAVVLGDAFYAWRSFHDSLQWLALGGRQLRGYFRLPYLLGMTILPIVSTRRHKLLVQLAGLLLLLVAFFLSLRVSPVVRPAIQPIVLALFAWCCRPPRRLWAPLAIVLLLGNLGLTFEMAVPHPTTATRGPRPAEIIRELEANGAADARVMTYGPVLPLLYPDPHDERFCARMKYQPDELAGMAARERLFVLVPPEDSRAASGFPTALAGTDGDCGRQFLRVQRWKNGWQLLEFLGEAADGPSDVASPDGKNAAE